MGTKYASQSVAGYNIAPPPDDGSQISANKISWATIKTKLPDPILTFAQAINTALLAATDVSNSVHSVAYTTLASDHLKPIEVSSGAPIHLGSASAMGVGYQVTIKNTDLSLASTVDLINITDTLDGSVAGSTLLEPGQSITVATSTSGLGYYTLSRGWGIGGLIVEEQTQFNNDVTIAGNHNLTLIGATAQFRAPANLSPTPSYSWFADPATGMTLFNTSELRLVVAGVTQVTITPSAMQFSQLAGVGDRFVKCDLNGRLFAA